MKTPQGGQRDTIWVIQYRLPPVNGTVTDWTRHATAYSAAATRAVLGEYRSEAPQFEWRAIRVETTQRAEDW